MRVTTTALSTVAAPVPIEPDKEPERVLTSKSKLQRVGVPETTQLAERVALPPLNPVTATVSPEET